MKTELIKKMLVVVKKDVPCQYSVDPRMVVKG